MVMWPACLSCVTGICYCWRGWRGWCVALFWSLNPMCHALNSTGWVVKIERFNFYGCINWPCPLLCNRPFAQLLSGLETGHPAAAGPSPAYDFSVFDERNAVFLVSVLDCFGCFSSGLDHLNSSWSIARLREHFRRKIGHSGKGRKPSFVSGKCPYIVTSNSTHRVPPVSLWLFKVRFFGFWFGLSKLKLALEHRSSERVLEKKRGHSRLLFKKAEPLERQLVALSRHLAYTLRCVYTPGAFPSATWNKQQQQKSLLAQTSPALQPLPLAFCQLPIVSGLSIWPRRRRGKHIAFPSSTCFVLSLGTHAGEKKTRMALHLLSGSVKPYSASKNWWWKSPQALRHEHESENLFQGGRAQCIRPCWRDAEVRPVSLTNGK